MPTYTSQTTLGTTNPSAYADSQPTLKKFWMTIDASDPDVLNLFDNYTPMQDNSYIENITEGSSFDLKIGTPSVTNFGYDAMIATAANQQTIRQPIFYYGSGIPGIIYAEGAAANPIYSPGVYQPPFAWADGLWHWRTEIVFDGDNTYESDAYFLLTENLDCCMAKYAAKIGSGCTAKALDKMTKMLTYRDMAYKAFEQGAYDTASTMLKKATELCSQTGCNCGCN